MIEWFTEVAASVSEHPVLQGVIAAASTFVLEDPTTVACGLLVADGKLTFLTALVGVSVGIALGDFGLYGVGRIVGPKAASWGVISPGRMERARHLFDRNLVVAIVLSRFLPGMRLPTYMGAGVFGASAVRFLLVAVFASLVWTFLLLSATLKFGEVVLPFLGDLKWPAGVGLIVLLIFARRLGAKTLGASNPEDIRQERPVSRFELLPPALFYVPVAGYYAWLSLRHLNPMLPTAANPSIYSGGLIGESKSEILDLVPEGLRHHLSRYVSWKVPGTKQSALSDSLRILEENQLSFPFVAKPDIGQRGIGVQLIRNSQQLRDYVSAFPGEQKLIFQELADYPEELGVLYFRFPGEAKGTILSVTRKVFPNVVGDGRQTLRELILNDPRAALLRRVYFKRWKNSLDLILNAGEELQLVFAGNHCQGAIFRNASDFKDGRLGELIEGIAKKIPGFYFGRFDIRFKDLDSLLGGRHLKIIEINGAGAEATHIWDSRMGVVEAYRVLFRQFSILFEIGKRNTLRGVPTVSPLKFLKDCWSFWKLSKDYPGTS